MTAQNDPIYIVISGGKKIRTVVPEGGDSHEVYQWRGMRKLFG